MALSSTLAAMLGSIKDKMDPSSGFSTAKLQPQDMMTAGAAPAPQGATPFAPLMAQMPQSGFARPEAQQWMQQALSSPYMQGWGNGTGGASPAAPGSPGIAPGAPSPTAPGTAGQVFGQLQGLVNQAKPSAGDKSKEAITNFASIVGPAALSGMGGAAGALGGALGGASALGPIGAMVGMGLNVISKMSSSSNGWRNTGLDEAYMKKMAAQAGWKRTGGKGGLRFTKNGQVVKGIGAEQQMFEDTVNLIRSTGQLPPKVKSHAGTQAYQALIQSGIFGPEITQQAVDKYGTGGW